MKIFKILLILPLLCSCAKGQGISLHPYQNKNETPAQFKLCHGFSCKHRTDISIPDKDWQEVLVIFSVPSKNAKDERTQIAKAIAIIEAKVTAISNMTPDRAKAENFETDQDQMDCLDETINTSRYLKFLEKENVFKRHKVSDPIHRGYFVDGMWPHNSATIKELKTGEIYAVDTYYFANGETPPVIPRDIWLDDWNP